jgi:hypothetical protein
MRTNLPRRPRHLTSVRSDRIDEGHVTVETPEHEVIEFEGCSKDEVDAKVHDFQAWAS